MSEKFDELAAGLECTLGDLGTALDILRAIRPDRAGRIEVHQIERFDLMLSIAEKFQQQAVAGHAKLWEAAREGLRREPPTAPALPDGECLH